MLLDFLASFKRLGATLWRQPPCPPVHPEPACPLKQPSAPLPAWVAHDPIVQKYRALIGDLPWACFPERSSDRNWPGPSPDPRAPFVAAYLVKLHEGKRFMSELRSFLLEHPAFVWWLGFERFADPSYTSDVPRWWCGCQTPSGSDRVTEISPHHCGQPESVPYRVALTTYHEERWVLPWSLVSICAVRWTMLVSAPSYRLFVGVDIAATSFASAWTLSGPARGRAQTFSQSPDGFTAFQAALARTGVEAAQTLIVLEATGSYWITLAVTLHQAGYAVSVVNPAHAHNFLRSLPRRAKTDALDAQMLAQFAAERQPQRWSPPEQVYHELRQRLLVRDGLLTMRQQARNQRHALEQWPVTIEAALTALDKVVAECDRQLQSLEREIATVLQEGAWAETAGLLASISGVGLVTSAWLLVSTVNFTACASAEAAAAYAGLVPLAHESGTSVRGRRQIGHAGNARLRTALYMATLSAARYNPVIRAQYERLRAAGKPTKVARCACARKLLYLAYAVVTKGQEFDPHYREHSG